MLYFIPGDSVGALSSGGSNTPLASLAVKPFAFIFSIVTMPGLKIITSSFSILTTVDSNPILQFPPSNMIEYAHSNHHTRDLPLSG